MTPDHATELARIAAEAVELIIKNHKKGSYVPDVEYFREQAIPTIEVFLIQVTDPLRQECEEYKQTIEMMEQHVSKVYSTITNNQVSKVNTDSAMVIAMYEDEVTKLVAEQTQELKYDLAHYKDACEVARGILGGVSLSLTERASEAMERYRTLEDQFDKETKALTTRAEKAEAELAKAQAQCAEKESELSQLREYKAKLESMDDINAIVYRTAYAPTDTPELSKYQVCNSCGCNDKTHSDKCPAVKLVAIITQLRSRPCPHVSSSDEGTQCCTLGLDALNKAEKRVKELEGDKELLDLLEKLTRKSFTGTSFVYSKECSDYTFYMHHFRAPSGQTIRGALTNAKNTLTPQPQQKEEGKA